MSIQQKIIFLLLALFVLYNCSDVKEQGSYCDNITCSNHGECFVKKDKAICYCEKEFHAEKLECIKDSFKCGVTEHEENKECKSNSKVVNCLTTNIPDNAIKIDSKVEIIWKNGSWSEPQKCSWTCNKKFHKNGDNCESDSKIVDCLDNTPDNATKIDSKVEIIWENGNWSEPQKCSFTCNLNFNKEGEMCVVPEVRLCSDGVPWNNSPHINSENENLPEICSNTSCGKGFKCIEENNAATCLSDEPILAVLARKLNFDNSPGTDYTIWRTRQDGILGSAGRWTSRVANGTDMFNFGNAHNGDIPTPGDFNGDGKSEAAYYSVNEKKFYIKGHSSILVGETSKDIPFVGDYDGDGKDDLWITTLRNVDTTCNSNNDCGAGYCHNLHCTGEKKIFKHWIWKIYSINGTLLSEIDFGLEDEIPVPGNYNITNKMEPAVFRPVTQEWKTRASIFKFGNSINDLPVPGDYNGDGLTDMAILQKYQNGVLLDNWIWKINGSEDIVLGITGDIPVPGDYNGDGKDEVMVYRKMGNNYHWFNSQTNVSWGTFSDDIPISAFVIRDRKKLPKVNVTRKISNNSNHEAFTSLVYFNNSFILAYRKASNHRGRDGVIGFYKSSDGYNWEELDTLTMPERYREGAADARDPGLAVINDKLWLLVPTADHSGSSGNLTYLFSSNNGTEWINHGQLGEDHWWFWKTTEYQNYIYSIAYTGPSIGKNPRLCRTNGIELDCCKISEEWQHTDVSNPSEGSTLVLPDGRMIAIFRKDGKGDERNKLQKATLGITTDNNFNNWSLNELDIVIHSPHLRLLKDGRVLLISRIYLGAYRATSLSIVDYENMKIEPFSFIHYGNNINNAEVWDQGYVDSIELNGKLWVSSYATTLSNGELSTDIYISEIDIK